MKKIMKKGIIIASIYLVFAAYLFVASDRIERLDKNDSNEKVNVSIKFSE